MRCFVCHPIQLELLDVQGKHKGLMRYNKNHGISALRKQVCHEHLDSYKTTGTIFVAKGYKNPKWKINKNCPPFSNHIYFWQPTTLSQIKSFTTSFFGGLGSLCCKGLLIFFLFKINGYDIWFSIMWVCTISILPPNGD